MTQSGIYGTFPPTWAIPTTVTKRKPTAPTTWPTNYRFSAGTKDLALSPTGQVIHALPREAAVLAAAKIMTTQRGAYPIYDRDFGADIEGALQAGTRTAIETALEHTMRQSIRPPRDARMLDAVDFAFVWGPDNELAVEWTLVLADGTRVRGSIGISTLAPSASAVVIVQTVRTFDNFAATFDQFEVTFDGF